MRKSGELRRSWVILPSSMPFAIINAMNVKIDKAGRIVLPKQVRNRLRLRAGSDLEIEERPEGIILRPVGQKPAMVQRNGIWVHLGKAPRDFDWSRAVDDDREDRLKDISGL